MEAFPRWRLCWRHIARTEAELGSLPMVIVTPVVGATVGAAWAASLPIREIVRRGVVVAQASFWHVLLFVILGVLLGIVLVTAGVVLVSIASYRLRGDPAWKVHWDLSDNTTPQGVVTKRNGVQLVCVSNPPVDVTTLGYVDAVVRLPSGEFRLMPQHGMGPLRKTRNTANGLWFPPVGLMHGPIPGGKYAVRWYGTTTRRKRFEVAPGEHTVW